MESTGAEGVKVDSAGGSGMYANTTRASQEWGFDTPDKIRASAGYVSAGPLMLVAQNSDAGELEPGDVVAAVGLRSSFADGPDPVPLVGRADGESRAGVIGVVLSLTVLASFILMYLWGVNMDRISLGALIIALGMLVDNAIVVTEGMMIRIQSGMDRLKAAKGVVSQNAIPLFGATVIAVLAFAAIGVSEDNTGEYCRSLFQVMLVSLMISWVIAITITPLFCTMFLKGSKEKTD